MRKILNIILMLIISWWAIWFGIYLSQKNIPDPLPPIDIPVEPIEPTEPVLTNCLDQNTTDARISCQIQYYPDSVQHFEPKKQISISGTREQNNAVINNHIYNSRHAFKINNNSYILIITKNPIAHNRDLFFWLNGKNEWAVHKNKNYIFFSDKSEDTGDTTYIFSPLSIEVSSWATRILTATSDTPISFAIWESGNYVTDIYVVDLPTE